MSIHLSNTSSSQDFAENLRRGFSSSQAEGLARNPYRQAQKSLDRIFESRELFHMEIISKSITRLSAAQLNAIDQKIADLFTEKKIIHRICKKECDDWTQQTNTLWQCLKGSSIDIAGFGTRNYLSGNKAFGQIIAICTLVDFCVSGIYAVKAGMQMFDKRSRLKKSTYLIGFYRDISNVLHDLIFKQKTQLREDSRQAQFLQLSQAIESTPVAMLTNHQQAFFGPRAGPIRVPRSSESSNDEGPRNERVCISAAPTQPEEELKNAIHLKHLADSKALAFELENKTFRAQIQALQDRIALLENTKAPTEEIAAKTGITQ